MSKKSRIDLEMKEGLIQYFLELPDPRIDRRKKHLLMDILVIAICAVICGARGWDDIEIFGRANLEWFEEFLKLPHGIPSHDTFARVFARLDPGEFQKCFVDWVQSIRKSLGIPEEGGTIAIDGKTLRRSLNEAAKKSAIHIVNVWAVEERLVLAQLKVDEKSNEITAVPKLLSSLDLRGQVVTMDAMGCQKKNAALIFCKGGDYVLALKGNQPDLHADVKLFFETAKKENFSGISHEYEETTDKEHGRIEVRKYWQVSEVAWLRERHLWTGLESVGMVESTRIIQGKSTTETRYFINSLRADVKKFAKAARAHWGIENSLHWCLDVAMSEDQSRIRAIHAAENFSLLRKIALNLFKQDRTRKRGIEAKQRNAGWDRRYMLQVLFGSALQSNPEVFVRI
jgi:predicted transposase YbfD/YdcC